MLGKSGFVLRSLFVTFVVSSLVACTFEPAEEDKGSVSSDVNKNGKKAGANDDTTLDAAAVDIDGGPYGDPDADIDGGPYDSDGGIDSDGGPYAVDAGPYDGGPYAVDAGPYDGGHYASDGGASGNDSGL